ncbi:hypothetical protein [Caloranaerobacter azorensis]|uniref:Copper transport outer membrane protein, MctB n=3 Tax=Caloranaerobacter azorensis TaxID=116090 RepID=A0A1M5WMB5_9FIRM|nr:hypothetical protein [Caloranaerobacter azorensis]KGG81409.1 hypothetical protein Y919_00155 [Caloranaerobacter azorensis H53214]QIB26022.1 hypothetical protein G3A45_01065 [Caloranaerobacter azorensis]SHH88647.1 hypothetical protein SAMN02745135_02552 [Caloranaerobacter azorensis DSM 13643]
MYQNIKNNIIIAISIFISLSIGIYIGYIIDLQSNMLENDEKLINLIEKQISYLESENELLRKQILKENNVNCLIESPTSSINLKKLINIQITFISYEEDLSYSDFLNYIKELGVNDIDIFSIKRILIKEISKSANLNEINNREMFKAYIRKCLEDLFSTTSYESNIKSRELFDDNNGKYKNFIIFIKDDEVNRTAFIEKIIEEILVQMCRERELPLLILQKGIQDNDKQIFIKK